MPLHDRADVTSAEATFGDVVAQDHVALTVVLWLKRHGKRTQGSLFPLPSVWSYLPRKSDAVWWTRHTTKAQGAFVHRQRHSRALKSFDTNHKASIARRYILLTRQMLQTRRGERPSRPRGVLCRAGFWYRRAART